MRWKAELSYIALCAVALTACNDDDSNGGSGLPPFSDTEYAVYMAYKYDSLASASAEPILCSGIWTNAASDGAPSLRKLSPGRDEMVEVFDICVTENKDVYAAGCFGDAALYWKNDTEVELPEGRAATGIEVDPDGVVYTCGFQQEGSRESAKMWIGTIPYDLNYGTRANDICLYDGKSYVAGYGNNFDKYDVEEARIWIDGQSYNRLAQDNDGDKNSLGDYPAVANAIVSNGFGWWCVGYERNTSVGYLPKVWIDRTNNNLTREGPASSLTCIKHEDGVYYIGGNDGFHAKYWTARQKSDKEKRIVDCVEHDLTSGSSQAIVEDIDVLNGIVVCCGYEKSKSDSYIPKLWINGNEYPLGAQLNGKSRVRPCAVAIVRR